jgi:hypothetical protein
VLANGSSRVYAVAMPIKKRAKMNVRYLVSPRHVDAREILALARGADKPLFHVSGPGPTAKFLKDMLKLMGVPARRVRPDENSRRREF